MSYRDWGRGEDAPREPLPLASWADPAGPVPAGPYEHATDRHRTPSRRRAVERGQREPEETYLPRWALESGVRRADGGRHAAPDDEPGSDADLPRSDGGWRATETTSSWRRVSETSWREAPSPAVEPDHTGEWTFERPDDRGYSGRRRADDDPVSGPGARSRPRRTPSRRPQVVWSGLEEADAAGPGWETERPARRGRRAAEDRVPVDPWDRESPSASAQPLPQPPAVDPWDASGVHAWRPAGEVDPWDHGGAGRWDRPDETGQWHQPDSTGQWERDGWDRTVPPRSGGGTATAWPVRDDRDEVAWSLSRLAGDDPRWTDRPVSPPRSAVAPYTAPRPRPAPRRPVAGPVGSAPGVRRRGEAAGAWGRRIEDDLLDPDPGGPGRPLLLTVACYLLPAALIFVWLLTLDGQPPAGCVTDISGGGCDSPRARAVASLASGLPRYGLALASSLVVALLLHRVGTTWRSATVALAAAVVGGGLSTVMISAVTGQPIG
ncbi:hypothetical protein [Micromonospora sp. CPCC 205561]|uniref:hypothetical protein n=1 Tax=Micromonospora sp. CPCC 205561 TaxID=3122407 RepID=UPI002FF39560